MCYRSTLWSLSEVSHTMVRTGGVKHSGITLTLIHNYIVKCLRTKSLHSSCTYKMFSIFIFLVNSNTNIKILFFNFKKLFINHSYLWNELYTKSLLAVLASRKEAMQYYMLHQSLSPLANMEQIWQVNFERDI